MPTVVRIHPPPRYFISGSSSFGRAIAFQAIGGQFEPGLPLQLLDENGRCGSVVEHFLGKEEVVSSILINGSKTSKKREKELKCKK